MHSSKLELFSLAHNLPLTTLDSSLGCFQSNFVTFYKVYNLFELIRFVTFYKVYVGGNLQPGDGMHPANSS
jgi:hypothetical protein